MKKILILISMATAVLFGCVKPELETPATDGMEYNTVLNAVIPETKIAIDESYSKLSWNSGDKISVLTSKGVYKDFVYEGADGATSAEFKGNLDAGETVAGYAVYPANADHTTTGAGLPSVNLASEYEWNDAEVLMPMVAVISGGDAVFEHAGGLFAFDVKNVPAGAKGFKFATAGKGITGNFDYNAQKTLNATEVAEGSNVTMTFDALAKAADMKFFIPVPAGTYESFTIYYVNSDGKSVEIKASGVANEVKRAQVRKFTVSIDSGIWYVTPDGTSEADGLSWADATSLSNAIAKASEGDVIYVAAGTYIPDTFITGKVVDAEDVVAEEVTTATDDAHKAFIINKNITLVGGFKAGTHKADPANNATILSGNDVCNHVVIVAAPKVAGKQVKMSGFTVTKAASTKIEGGWNINDNSLENYTGSMAVVGASLSIENMKFTGNKTVNASGIYGANSKVDIKDCVFTENTSSGNGTVWFSDGSELTFSDSEISNNTADNAAGLYLQLYADKSMTANVSDVTITGNTSSTRGAVYLRTATAGQTLNAVLDGLTITDNKGATGAGIYILNASGMTIQDTEMSENQGTGSSEGGALYSLDAGNTFKNCTFNNNTASGNGTFLIQSNAVAILNTFDGCEWSSNSTTGFGNMYIYGKATDNNAVITNSIFNGNEVTGRGGALYVRATGNGKVDCKCANTTFHSNSASSRGTAVVSYSNNANYFTNVDLISCTVFNNTNKGKYEAVMAETNNANITSATVNLYNTLIEGNVSAADDSKRYDSAVYSGGKMNATKCQCNGENAFDYTTMLGALTEDGVCPLLLPESNPAFTSGMTAAELSALASTNVPATVLMKDQLGNERTGKVIGAWAATAAASSL